MRTSASGRPDADVAVTRAHAERAQHRGDRRRAGALGGGEPDVVLVDQSQVEPVRARGGDDLAGPAGHRDGERVEPGVVDDLDPAGTQGCGDPAGVVVGALRDPAQAVGSVVDGVHRRDDGQQHLGGADVGRRLVAADVLLAGLEGEAVGRASLRVDRDTDEAAGQVALEPGRDRHEAGVRTAVEEGYAEALGRADDDVGTEGAGRLEQGEREDVGGDDGQPTALVDGVDHGTRVADGARGAGVLHEHAGDVAVGQALGQVGDDDLDAQPLGAGADDVDGLREGVGVDDERAGGVALRTAYERHGLRGRGALVEQRGVGGRQAGEVGDDGLEVEQRLEPALGDLGLVGRVGGVPGRVLEHVAPDDRRRDRRVVAQADHRLGRPVLRRERPQRTGGGLLVERLGEVEPRGGADAAGDGRRHQRLQRLVADHLQHVGDGRVVGPDVAGDELTQRAGSG